MCSEDKANHDAKGAIKYYEVIVCLAETYGTTSWKSTNAIKFNKIVTPKNTTYCAFKGGPFFGLLHSNYTKYLDYTFLSLYFSLLW